MLTLCAAYGANSISRCEKKNCFLRPVSAHIAETKTHNSSWRLLAVPWSGTQFHYFGPKWKLRILHDFDSATSADHTHRRHRPEPIHFFLSLCLLFVISNVARSTVIQFTKCCQQLCELNWIWRLPRTTVPVCRVLCDRFFVVAFLVFCAAFGRRMICINKFEFDIPDNFCLLIHSNFTYFSRGGTF